MGKKWIIRLSVNSEQTSGLHLFVLSLLCITANWKQFAFFLHFFLKHAQASLNPEKKY